MKSNIALVGFMGTGKSSVGLELSKLMGTELVEVDNLIAERAGKSIPEIFSEDGEVAFRKHEIAIVDEVSQRKGVVISCGGGAVLESQNVTRLRKNSVIILLTKSMDEILYRTAKDGESRPLLNTTDRIATVKKLLELRHPFYIRAADYIVDASGLDSKEVAKTIISCLPVES